MLIEPHVNRERRNVIGMSRRFTKLVLSRIVLSDNSLPLPSSSDAIKKLLFKIEVRERESGSPSSRIFFSEGRGSGYSTAGNPKRRLEPHPLPQEDHLNLNNNKQGIITKKIILWWKKLRKNQN